MTMNQVAVDYFCKDIDFFEGKLFNEIIRNVSLQQIVTDSLTSSDLLHAEVTIEHPKKVYFQVHGIRLKDANDVAVGALLVLHDVTNIRKLEHVRQNFVANVSHELKTPITLIKGFLDTLLNGAANNSNERDEFLRIIQNHAYRLEAIIEDLLSLSHVEQDNYLTSIDMNSESFNDIIERAILACHDKAKEGVSIIFG